MSTKHIPKKMDFDKFFGCIKCGGKSTGFIESHGKTTYYCDNCLSAEKRFGNLKQEVEKKLREKQPICEITGKPVEDADPSERYCFCKTCQNHLRNVVNNVKEKK